MLRRLRSGRALALIAGVLVLGAVGAYLLYDRYVAKPGDIRNDPNVEFVEPEPEPEGRKAKLVKTFTWPRYGFTKDHTRNYQPGYTLKAPFELRWKRKASALTEFPPVLHRNVLYQLSDDGWMRAFTVRKGRLIWKKRLGRLSASSPALDGERIYATLLQGPSGGGRGRVVAIRERDGRPVWSRSLPSRTESSPLVHDGKVYIGSEDGTLYCLWARTGRIAWTYRARGAIKGSPTLSRRGILYFGDYGGYVHAVGRRSGNALWAKRVAGRGRFYATAAVAYGRVFIGATDGREYALSAKTGRIAWARQTGDYVYSSAAVANVPGRGPTVFFGSYDGRLYALDARSGSTRWAYRSGGRISGSPTVVGNVVYFSDLGLANTFGVDIRSGRLVLRRAVGGYDPVISDGRHLFVTGRRSLFAWLASNAPEEGRVRQPPGTSVAGGNRTSTEKLEKRAAKKAAKRRAAKRRAAKRRAERRRRQNRAIRRCVARNRGDRGLRTARKRCKARIRRR